MPKLFETPQAILFDIDGTLLDTAPELLHWINVLLKKKGKAPIALLPFRETVSLGTDKMLEYAFHITPSDPWFCSLKAQFLNLYKQDIGFQTQFFPGIETCLAALTEKKITWGIVTNRTTAFTTALIEKFAIFEGAQCVVCADTVGFSKPHPAPLLAACQLLRVSPNACWYVGDVKIDVEASHAAGMRCAIASYGYSPALTPLQAWHADHYFHKAEELMPLF